MKKLVFLLTLVAFVFSSCNMFEHQITQRGWFTQVDGSGVDEGDSIYLEAGITMVSFTQDDFSESSGTVKLMGKGSVYYLINNDEFGLISKDGKKMPAVMDSFSSFDAVGTWTADGDNVTIKWNTDSVTVSGDLGKCANLNEKDAELFMLKFGSIVSERSAKCHPQVLKIFNEWLEQRSKLTYDAKEEVWNATVDGKPVPALWSLKKKDE